MRKRASLFLRFPYYFCTFPAIELEREAGRGVLRSGSLPLRESEKVHAEKERADTGCPVCYIVTIVHQYWGFRGELVFLGGQAFFAILPIILKNKEIFDRKNYFNLYFIQY